MWWSKNFESNFAILKLVETFNRKTTWRPSKCWTKIQSNERCLTNMCSKSLVGIQEKTRVTPHHKRSVYCSTCYQKKDTSVQRTTWPTSHVWEEERGRSEEEKIISSTQDWISSESKYRKITIRNGLGPFLEEKKIIKKLEKMEGVKGKLHEGMSVLHRGVMAKCKCRWVVEKSDGYIFVWRRELNSNIGNWRDCCCSSYDIFSNPAPFFT